MQISNIIRLLAALLLVFPFSSTAFADVSLRFFEGAPKDRFSFQNIGTCPIGDTLLKLDLSGSRAGLIFDITASGAGVEVFQPLEIVSGASALRAIPKVRDGDQQVTFEIASLQPGETISFTIDVDDTMGRSETIVSGSEISGASVELSKEGRQSSGIFGSDARGKIALNECSVS